MKISTFTLGPLGNNSYLLADPSSGQAAVIDPSFDPQPLLDETERQNLAITAIWLTHAHFDHIAGCAQILQACRAPVALALHPADLPLWKEKGGARMFGFQLDSLPEPNTQLQHGQMLRLGENQIIVRHTPGHCPGHVVFYAPASQVVFSGDLIFYRSIGRSDLPGGSNSQLSASIRSQIYSLPPEVLLLPGHGPQTSVQEEIDENPYVGP